MTEIENDKHSVFCFCCKKTFEKSPTPIPTVNGAFQPEDALKVPYSGEVPQNLTTGNVICVTGNIKPKCSRFAINLIARKAAKTDIAFHFNPRLDRNYIVRNACIGEKWGLEEAASTTKCDLFRNKKFEIVYLITNSTFMVSVNGKHFCTFAFRVPLNLVTDIEVDGDVDIFNVEYKKLAVYPENTASLKTLVIHVNSQEEQPIELLSIPCTGHLPNGFEEGWQLEVYGRVKLLPHSFYFNLQDGAQIWPHPIISLHVNPRFKAVAGENVIVRNAWIDGHWGTEERSPGFPFTPGSPFCIAIRKVTERFELWIDGVLIGEFKFRTATAIISTIYIQGDIILKKIALHNKFVELQKPQLKLIKL